MPVNTNRTNAKKQIQQLITPRLLKLGAIRTNDAWQLCRHLFSYEVIRITFKEIMEELVAQGKADHTTIKGVYFIHNNKR